MNGRYWGLGAFAVRQRVNSIVRQMPHRLIPRLATFGGLRRLRAAGSGLAPFRWCGLGQQFDGPAGGGGVGGRDFDAGGAEALDLKGA